MDTRNSKISSVNEAISNTAAQIINALGRHNVVRCQYPSIYDEDDVVQVFQAQLRQKELRAIFLPERFFASWVCARCLVSFIGRHLLGRRSPLVVLSRPSPAYWRKTFNWNVAFAKLIELERTDAFPFFSLELVERINSLRSDFDLCRIKKNKCLAIAANRHCKDLSSRQDFSHTGTDGSSPAFRAAREGYSNRRVSENIALGVTDPRELAAAWMASTPHRRNLLDDEILHYGLSDIRLNKLGQPIVVLLLAGGAKRHPFEVIGRKLAKYRLQVHRVLND
jgi:hypothetical protein